MALFYVKKQEEIAPHRYFEYAVRKSGTVNLQAAKRLADKVGGFVTQYPGNSVIYSPKMRELG